MTFFAANRCLQISLEFQSRSLRISSLAKKGYNTSGPVRYIPKSYSPIKKPQKPPALESCEKKQGILFKNRALEGKRGARKLPKFEDEDSQNSLFRAENSNPSDIFEQVEELPELEDEKCSSVELINVDVGSNSELIIDKVPNSNEDKIAESDDLLSHNIRQDAEKMAIELLSARAYTELELRKKLRGKKYPPNIVESVIADIKCRISPLQVSVQHSPKCYLLFSLQSGDHSFCIRGLLNDGLYAESFSRSRWLSLTWGPRRIRQVLIQKGVTKVEAEKATKQVFEDDVDGDGRAMQHGMSKASMDRLFLQASKQWLRGQTTSPENRKARIVRWLQYRGFNWGVTNAILKKLEAQYPP